MDSTGTPPPLAGQRVLARVGRMAEDPMAEPSLTIRQVCDQTGLSPRTVRYYEELGLLPDVRRKSGGRRVYRADELERLRFIQRLKTLGLSLAQIRELNAVYAIAGSTRDMLARLDRLLDERLEQLDARIAELTDLRGEIHRYRVHIQRRAEALGAGRRSA